jgi:hypothetical protein
MRQEERWLPKIGCNIAPGICFSMSKIANVIETLQIVLALLAG